jgi:phosphoglycolate phosphatase
VFFDFDGTLVDVRQRHHRTYRSAVEALGGRPLGPSAYWLLKRRGIGWTELLACSRLGPRQQGAFLERFIAQVEAPASLRLDRLFPGVPELLEARRRRGDRLFLVSLRRSLPAFQAQVAELGIRELFERVCSGHTEADAHIQKARLIRRIGVGSPAAVVGDTEADILAARSLGLAPIGVASGMRNRNYLQRLGAQVVVERIAQLPAALDSVSPSAAAIHAACSARPCSSDTVGW